MTGSFSRRTVVNKQPMDVEYPGANVVIGDWLKVAVAVHTVVTCCQVLEHISDQSVRRFAKKLMGAAEVSLIISVPYMWPKGRCIHHQQDPISFAKLERIMDAPASRYVFCTDNHSKRLVAEYRI